MAWFRYTLAIYSCVLAFSSVSFADDTIHIDEDLPVRETLDFTKAPGKYVGQLLAPGPGCHGTLRGCKNVMGCTATLVGPHLIATAGHCLPSESYDKDKGPQSEAAQGAVFFLHDSNQFSTAFSSVEAVYQEKIFDKASTTNGNDWTLARLASPLGRKVGWLDVTPNVLKPGAVVSAAGYAVDWNGGAHAGIDPECEVVPAPMHITLPELLLGRKPVANKRESVYTTTCELEHGASGGPMVVVAHYKLSNGQELTIPFLAGINASIDGEFGYMTATTRFYGAWQHLLAEDLLEDIDHYAKDRPELASLAKESHKAYQTMLAGEIGQPVPLSPLNSLVSAAVSVELVSGTIAQLRLNRERFFQIEAQYDFGATFLDNSAPLRVVSVQPGSTAAKMNLVPGDIVEQVNKEVLPTAYELQRELNKSSGQVFIQIKHVHSRGKGKITVPSRKANA